MLRQPIPVVSAGYDQQTEQANAALIGNFLGDLRLKRWSKVTITNYEVALRQFFNYCAGRNLRFTDVAPHDAKQFIAVDLAEYAPNSQRLKISCLRSFYDYIQGEGYSGLQPFLNSFFPRTERVRFTYFTNEDFEDFIEYLAGHSSYPVILGAKFMRYAGLRVSEASDVDIHNDLVQTEYGYDIYVKGKGGKERAVPIFSRSFCDELKQLRALYPSPGLPVAAIFSPNTMGKHLRNYSKQIGRDPAYTSHDMRRAFAVDLMQQTGNIDIVRMALGHSEYTTTLIYIRDQYQLVKAAAGTVRM